MEGYQWGGGGVSGGKGTWNRKYKWQVQNSQGEVKNSMGNGEAKEFICATHGHELRGGNTGGTGDTGQRRIKGKKKGTTVIA